MAKAAELRDLTDEELMSRLREAREELFTLRFQLATGQQENTARIGRTKKDVARIETILRQREIEAAEAAEAQETS
ncbi:MAG TPA: 50S ribosomal protein L29 [Acidimicrobiales bacterium]